MSAFATAASRYWGSVFWMVCREVRHWELRARAIPDPSLRRVALTALHCERGNLEGAGAYAAFLPPTLRARVVRACVAFQAAYDYADALSEQPSPKPSENARCLHSVLCAALGERSGEDDYYRHHPNEGDGGYLESLRDGCYAIVRRLPAFGAVADAAQEAARRIAAYQSLNLSESSGGRDELARWAQHNTPAGSRLRWWETAAAAGSSLLVFALISGAASCSIDAVHAEALTLAYFPWIGALHTLLDSMVDELEDLSTGHRSLLDCYGSPSDAAQRIGAIAAEAVRRAQSLPDGMHHRMILAAMTSFYTAGAPPSSPYARLIVPRVLAATGRLAQPSVLIMRARRNTARLSLAWNRCAGRA